MVDETWRCNIDNDGQSRHVVISMLGDGLWTCSVIPLVQTSYNTYLGNKETSRNHLERGVVRRSNATDLVVLSRRLCRWTHLQTVHRLIYI